ncbi:hypothetical protein EDC96DRAFT_58274 [Choanephora cucurbitarum]|nr:hypothetical protein EDC96DRAFT_58274 [Choanephora cucurbitarum]
MPDEVSKDESTVGYDTPAEVVPLTMNAAHDVDPFDNTTLMDTIDPLDTVDPVDIVDPIANTIPVDTVDPNASAVSVVNSAPIRLNAPLPMHITIDADTQNDTHESIDHVKPTSQADTDSPSSLLSPLVDDNDSFVDAYEHIPGSTLDLPDSEFNFDIDVDDASDSDHADNQDTRSRLLPLSVNNPPFPLLMLPKFRDELQSRRGIMS